MTTQRYTVTPYPIDALLGFVKIGAIAIPEIQRPFVWSATEVRNLIDSLYRGFPVGYLITWQNPSVRLKDGSLSSGKKILIDGQQRVTALMAALLGREVLAKDYRLVRIRIAFHPGEQRFAVLDAAIEKDPAWVPDIAEIFSPAFKMLPYTQEYAKRNPGADVNIIFDSLSNLTKIVNNHIGVIELADNLDIETVTEIFIRVNSSGVALSQADFAMSKIAVNETYGGAGLRKAIDYFCHMAVAPDFGSFIEHNDKSFAQSDYFPKMKWLKSENDALYDPSYVDMLRVSFVSEFNRGKLQDLVALLSGRNFETKQYEEAIIEDSFTRLKAAVLRFMNEDNFKQFILIIRSTGFVDPGMISSQNALDMAYVLYLTLRKQGLAKNQIQRYVRRWFVFSLLTGRYSASPETAMDNDIRQFNAQGIEVYASTMERSELSDSFWDVTLPQAMDTSSISSPSFRVFQAAQATLGDKGFLSRDIHVRDLLAVKSDVHHIFPRDFLKKRGLVRSQYNQIANYAVTQSEINIAIGNKEPRVYFGELLEQCRGGKQRYGNITTADELKANLSMNCIPEGIEQMEIGDYPDFLAARRKLMTQKMRVYFEGL